VYGRPIPVCPYGPAFHPVDGDEVEVPKSAFADLGDIVSVEVSRDGDNFALTIEGGDAAYSYFARLIFDKHRVLERRLYPGSFGNTWQRIRVTTQAWSYHKGAAPIGVLGVRVRRPADIGHLRRQRKHA